MLIDTPIPADAPVSVDHAAQMIDDQLRLLLEDLRTLLPCDVAAAWLGHDERPSLRVVLPAAAQLPPLDSARHLIFQTTTEAARISDLHTYPGLDHSEQRSWLGVPLVLHGRRRGWIELLSDQPSRFTDQHMQQAELVIRRAAASLSHLETVVHLRVTAQQEQRVSEGLERALLEPVPQQSLETLLAYLRGDEAVTSATLLLPSELAYALGVHQNVADVPLHAQRLMDEYLVTVVAHWSRSDSNVAAPEELTAQHALLPCVHDGETLGWISLQYAKPLPLGAAIVGSLPRMTGVMTSFLYWLREHLQREQQAQQSVRMLVQQAHHGRSAVITELMAGLAHELNNPVNALWGMAQLLQRDATVPESLRTDIDALTGEAHRMRELVQRLSNFGQSPGATKVPIKLNEVVGDTVAILSGVAHQRHITVQCDFADDSPLVLGNRAQLQQVCMDLLSNAFEAVQTTDTPRVQVRVTRDDSMALVEISDNGYGIPDDLRDKIFSPGFTTKTSGGTRRGLGIGLPMAADIVRNHWGAITVSSQLWEGSCFTLRFPLI